MSALDLSTHDAFLDRLLGLPGLRGASLSPQGEQLAWIWTRLGPTTQLWLAPADGGVAPRLLVADERWDCDYMHWSRDGCSLIVGQSQDGAERVSLLQVFLDGGPPRRLTPERPDYYVRGGQLLADRRTLIYAANHDFARQAEIEPFRILAEDIESGERRILAAPRRAAHLAFQVSPDDRFILYQRNDLHPAGQQLWLCATDGSFDREIVTMGAERKVGGSWSPDSRSILFVGEGETHHRAGRWRLDDGGIDWLIDTPRRNPERIHQPRRSAKIVIEEYEQACLMCSLLDPSTGAEARIAGHGSLSPLGVDKGGHWLGWHYDSRLPHRIVRLDDGFSLAREITRHPTLPPLAPEELVEAENYLWRAEDGLTIQGWLYRAAAPARGTIVLVHGGPTHHDEAAFDGETQYLVRCGFNVLRPNYRGSTGFSLAYQEAIKREGWGGAEQGDIAAGIERLIADGIAVPGRIGMTGTSYGGYSSWHAIVHLPPDRLAAAAPICGMTDLVVDYETTRPDLRPYSEEMMGGTPASAPERYRQRSPINFVESIRGRLLIVQGMNDPNVTPDNVAAVRQRLDAAGIPYELLTFADEGHGIAKPANRRLLYRRLAAFFAAAFQG